MNRCHLSQWRAPALLTVIVCSDRRRGTRPVVAARRRELMGGASADLDSRTALTIRFTAALSMAAFKPIIVAAARPCLRAPPGTP